jgi:hypothetical protein
MKIIVRSIGERTEKECIRRCALQGDVYVIRERPFGKAIKKTYELAMGLQQLWTPVVDADVFLNNDTLRQAIQELGTRSIKTFCLDGKTNDKILMKNRRAGIHIYNNSLLSKAIKYIDDYHIKPESTVRRKMSIDGFPTYVSKIIFGLHDYEQYYRDLWRKAVCQTEKIAGMVGNKVAKWKKLSRTDKDFFVVYEAHLWGKKNQPKIIIDSECDFQAQLNLQRLGIEEKGEYLG